MSVHTDGNSFYNQAQRMNENRKASGMPSSIPYCMWAIYPEYELTPFQVKILINTLNKF